MKLHAFFTGTLAVLLAGCVSPAPHVEEQLGLAVNTAKAQQTLNPDASRNTDPAAGIDGGAAVSGMAEYHKSFRAPPPTFPVINIGSGGGSGGQ